MKLESAAVIVSYSPFLMGLEDPSKLLFTVAKWLCALGYRVKKMSLIDDGDKSVLYELALFTKQYDIVIVIAKEDMYSVKQALANITSQELAPLLDDSNNLWPASCKVLKSNNCNNYIIYLQRIFVLNMNSLEDQQDILKSHLSHYTKATMYSKTFQVQLNGSKRLVKNLKYDGVNITFDKGVQETITLEGKDFRNVVRAEICLQNALDSGILGSNWNNSMMDMIYQSEDKQLRTSIKVIEKCLEDYGPDNVFLSFNGGKDCTVLLHLVQTILQKNYLDHTGKRKLFCLYVKSANAFKEQDEFIEQCMIFYNLEIMSITTNIKDALRMTISKKPHLKACFMGTRRTDPYCAHLNAFQMTDSDWPEVMRCSPFLDWHYSDIWDYLLYYKVPYCKLYDYGFTSLGTAINTIRNPSLLFADDDQKEAYLPAYRMLNEKKERSGRNVSKI